MHLESPTLVSGRPMPAAHTADGANTSPALIWSGVPGAARQLVVTLEDRDVVVPHQSPFLHWVVYNLRPTATGLAAAIPFMEMIPAPDDVAGAFQAYTAFSFAGYRGPQPPPGELHHYVFTLHALGVDLPLKPGLFANAVVDAIQTAILTTAELAVIYQRQPK